MLEETFLRAIVARAGQTGEVYEEGDSMEGVHGGLRGQVEVEGHFAVCGGGIVGEFEELAAEGCYCCVCLEGHCWFG